MDNKIESRCAWAEINLSNLDYNLSQLKSLLKNRKSKIMAVVKANAYGHGAVEISKRAIRNGAYGLGVAMVEEGVKLRNSGINEPIFLLGEIPDISIKKAIKYDLIPSINSLEKAKLISEKSKSLGKNIVCHINIDTGMNRIGINYREAVYKIREIIKLENLDIEGIFTHFSCASEKEDNYTELQWKRFRDVIDEIKGIAELCHCSNSAAFLKYNDMQLDMVRIGIAIYGLNPFGNANIEIGLKPLMSLKAKISFIKKVPAGECISYCATFKTEKESIIATIPIGYADGYGRILSNKARVIINGQYAPLVGNVTMDQIMIDITGIKGAEKIKPGHQVTLIGRDGGKEISASELAGLSNTINYEIVCNIGPRIPRIFIG